MQTFLTGNGSALSSSGHCESLKEHISAVNTKGILDQSLKAANRSPIDMVQSTEQQMSVFSACIIKTVN